VVHRLIVQYGQPTDPAAFDQHYRDVHVPLVQKVPGLVRFTVGHPRSMDPSTPAPYAVAELDFESAEAMGQALSTEEGRATGADVPTFASGGVSMASFDVDDVTSAG
jgi:uncharacterized protein (TIGR02118 family)